MKNIIFVIIFLLINGILFSQEKQKSDFRSELDILNYQINLDISDFKGKKLSGNTVITFRPRKKIKVLTFELAKLEVKSVFINGKETDDYFFDYSLIKIKLKRKLSPRKTMKVQIFYEGTPEIDARWGGFFFSDSTAFNMGVGMASTPQAYGRVWYPCIDNFTEKATYEFNITVPETHMAVCSGKFVEKKNVKDKKVLYKWKLEKEVPTYITSVAVGNYKLIEKIYKSKKREIPMQLYIEKTLANKAEASFIHLGNAVGTFEKHYGDYQWSRVGFVSVPFESGAMEHCCNIAYPEYAIDGTTERETLMAHELSHHWFGNLVTCKTSGDMWLNEGWASYSEALFKEEVYGEKAYKNYVRDNHEKVLEKTHIYDAGYRAVYGVPHNYTYGSTVYDKGADVAHTLRGYMGDSLFFHSLTAYLKAFAFSSASTFDFRDFLSKESGIDLTDFFETWVFHKGFPHFSSKIIETMNVDCGFQTKVVVNQNLKKRNFVGNNNFVELYFYDKNLNKEVKRINFSGKTDTLIFKLKIKPENIFIDLEEKISDATIDNYKIISEKGTYEFPNTNSSFEILNIEDSVLIQSKLNYMTPKYDAQKYAFSEKKYWTISGVANDSLQFTGNLYIDNANNGFLTPVENVTLLYRENEAFEWKEIIFGIQEINKYEAFLTVPFMKFGDYAVAEKK